MSYKELRSSLSTLTSLSELISYYCSKYRAFLVEVNRDFTVSANTELILDLSAPASGAGEAFLG
jgi:hypothetical protein